MTLEAKKLAADGSLGPVVWRRASGEIRQPLVKMPVDPVAGSVDRGPAGAEHPMKLVGLAESRMSFLTAEDMSTGEGIKIRLRDEVAQRELVLQAVVVDSSAIGVPGKEIYLIECGPQSSAQSWPRSVRALRQRLEVDETIVRLTCYPSEDLDLARTSSDPMQRFRYSAARDISDREDAYRLVYRAYRSKGLTAASDRELYTSKFLLNPSTVTFVGKVDAEVALTVTSIPDSSSGLPMDAVFEDCLRPLRANGRKLVEFGMLAVKPALFGAAAYTLHDPVKMASVYSLFRIALQHAKYVRGYTDVMFAIPPKHQALYRFMGVGAVSDVRYYSNYNTPAVCLRIDLEKLDLRPHVKAFLFDKVLPEVEGIGTTEWKVDELKRIFGE